ncbi:MAG TPA: energy transducer TonB [Longimicrobiaceae bacterium]|jgi:TonB family protein
MSMHSARRLLLAAAFLLAAAPGLHAQHPADSLLWARYRHVSVSEALDSAGLVARLRELPEPPTGKRALVHVKFSASGQVDSVAVRTGDRVAPEHLPALEAAIRASARTQPADTLLRWTSLALRTGKRVSLSGPEEQKPVLLNARAVERAVSVFARRNSALLADGPKGVMVKFVVTRDGRTEDARVELSSGVAAVDAAALDVAGTMRFDPAKIEGEPVPVLVQMPIAFFR